MTERTANILQSINAISPAEWNRCANPASEEYNPFLDHRFLRALEESGSAVAETGWQPFHLCLKESESAVAVAPIYLKSHSRGEYVFDSGWADAFYRAGGEYYPKMQVSIPFTPATGRRLLVSDLPERDQIEEQLLQALVQVARQIKVSSLHMTFLPKAQWDRAGKFGMLQRMDTQFHWRNDGYDTFETFLEHLSSKKRKNIRRERRDAVANDITIEWITGSDLKESHWDAFYDFYIDTGNRKWGTAYLSRSFFSLISELMPERTLLILCKRNGRYIAGAINFIGDKTLFGRNWGCREDHRFLHFETCYYQAIEFAIANQLESVEAGAQGSHKIARGYLAQPTYSAHWVRDAGFRDAISEFLRDERRYVEQDIEWVGSHTPFRTNLDLERFQDSLKLDQVPDEPPTGKPPT